MIDDCRRKTLRTHRGTLEPGGKLPAGKLRLTPQRPEMTLESFWRAPGGGW